MGFKLVTALAILTFSSTSSARIITQSDISLVLQNIMSPENTDKAMQLISIMARKANKNIGVPTRAVIDCGLPQIAMNEMPRIATTDMQRVAMNKMPRIAKIMLPREARSEMPRVIANDEIARVISDPRMIGAEMVYPQKVIRQTPTTIAVPQDIIYPCRTPVSTPNQYNIPVSAPNPACPVAYAPSPYLPYAAPTPSPCVPCSAPTPNPYLPLASPVSSMLPLPPPTQSKGQFLRKIPIPPPTM